MRRLPALLLLLAAGCAGGSAGNVRLTAEEERILRPLGDPPDAVRRLVADGDQKFLEGIPPFRRSDPETGADWQNEVKVALACYQKARESYLAAQGKYLPGPVPPPLLDRGNESLARIAILLKRQRSVPR
jgi:hypothetical protein